MPPDSAKSAKYPVFCGYTWKTPVPGKYLGIVPISSILPQILPQTSSQTQGNSRVSRMEHQTPSVFPGNFRKRKVLGTLCFPFCLPENLVQAKGTPRGELARRIFPSRSIYLKSGTREEVIEEAAGGGAEGCHAHTWGHHSQSDVQEPYGQYAQGTNRMAPNGQYA